jgi:hypothetical protein
MSKPKPPLILVGPGSTAPPPPRTLGPHGLSLWTRVQREYHILDCGGVELLCLAAQALDRAESLSEAIAEDGQTIRTRAGVRAHPALRRDVGDGELHRLARTIIKDNHLFDAPLVWRNLASFGSLNSFREFTGDT